MKNFDKKAMQAVMEINAAGYAVNSIGMLKADEGMRNPRMLALVTQQSTFEDQGESFTVTDVFLADIDDLGIIAIENEPNGLDINEALVQVFEPAVMENYKVIGGKAEFAA